MSLFPSALCSLLRISPGNRNGSDSSILVQAYGRFVLLYLWAARYKTKYAGDQRECETVILGVLRFAHQRRKAMGTECCVHLLRGTAGVMVEVAMEVFALWSINVMERANQSCCKIMLLVNHTRSNFPVSARARVRDLENEPSLRSS